MNLVWFKRPDGRGQGSIVKSGRNMRVLTDYAVLHEAANKWRVVIDGIPSTELTATMKESKAVCQKHFNMTYGKQRGKVTKEAVWIDA